jgi:hypothetical protein
MSIELGQFADLQIELPEGQAVLLVESRTYYMLGENLERDYERGEGLILHHEDLAKFLGQKPLPHLTDEIVYYMRGARSRWPNGNARSAEFENLLSDAYRDPLADDKDAHWLAAFAPVLISGRPDKQQDTGWFVIVQQRQREGEIVNRVN